MIAVAASYLKQNSTIFQSWNAIKVKQTSP